MFGQFFGNHYFGDTYFGPAAAGGGGGGGGNRGPFLLPLGIGRMTAQLSAQFIWKCKVRRPS